MQSESKPSGAQNIRPIQKLGAGDKNKRSQRALPSKEQKMHLISGDEGVCVAMV